MGLQNELKGITVVTIEQAVAASYASMLLADAGARVIKIERAEGDFARAYDRGAGGHSSYFTWLNRGKESITMDFDAPDERALLCTILRKADVFLSNLVPGALARRGLTGSALRQDNPGLITCSISGYGEEGEAATKKAYDFLVQAESGICAVTGVEEAPARVGVPLADIGTGLTAFSGIMRALYQRIATGEGVDIPLAMFDVMADWMNMPLLSYRTTGKEPGRLGLTHSFAAPYSAYHCLDGDVLISIQSNREWEVFCRHILGASEYITDPRFVDNPDRYANREDLRIIINECFGRYTRQEMIEKLDEHRIANAQLSAVADLSEHPFLRNATARIDDADITLASLPIREDGPRPERAPLLNQHGEALRKEFG